MKKLILIVSLLLPVMTVSAIEIETFPVSMDVLIPRTSTAIQIETDRTNFIAQYDSNSSKFRDLTLPFKVVVDTSKATNYKNYTLFIPSAMNLCADEGNRTPSGNITNGVESPITLELDSNPYEIKSGDKGMSYPVVSERNHRIVVKFSKLAQKGVLQECQGSLGLLAQLGDI